MVDPSGAAVPGAAVSLHQDATGAITLKTTDGSGEFVFNFLHIGVYTLNIEAQGFKKFQISGLEFAAAQNVRRSFTLELGAVAETVKVEATTPLVNMVSAEQRESSSSREVKELPLARQKLRRHSHVRDTAIATAASG